MEVSDEEVWCECSDEEMYNPGKEKKGTWQPKAEDILKLFDELKTKKVGLQLSVAYLMLNHKASLLTISISCYCTLSHDLFKTGKLMCLQPWKQVDNLHSLPCCLYQICYQVTQMFCVTDLQA